MSQKNTRFGLGMSAMLAATFALASCGSGSEPITLSDQDRAEIVGLVEDKGSAIEDGSCTIEVFRIEDDTTYGWATCVPPTVNSESATAQIDAFAFRIDGDKLSRPGEGAKYQEDLDKLFPEDLHTAINQHATGAA